MAKVGSLSIYNSLKTHLRLSAIFHIHTLNVYEDKHLKELLMARRILPSSRSPVPLINNRIINSKREAKIITLVRDPIERNLSAFFDAFYFMVGVKQEDFRGSLEDLAKIYKRDFPHEYAVGWFDNYLGSSLSVDVYKVAFPVEKGHLTVFHKKYPILILRSDLENSEKEKQIMEFLGLKAFIIRNTNITNASLYEDFKNYIKFSKEYLLSQYNSKYAQHFFSKEERNKALKKWLKVEH
ncbi:putative capsular polysaccharide synthesis family protein [Aestuariivivens sediminicola]|uniref:putative capsular polysaccharide synthesis family protein n=1 Tax=Aestuariivivens sediminicola TaxID=2913560 RepID=UPI001F5601EA|nr:putative capsular polysaccharide synthesis family protein [Aestuariivivens sediminicola]